MDRRYPFIRRRAKRARLQQRVAAALMLCIAGSTLGFALMGEPDPVTGGMAAPTLMALASTPAEDAPGKAAPRRIYPYSIVPGGAATQTELARVIRTDKVVAAHYASFDVDKARPVTVTRPRAVHVSYRKGDKVYWTAKKIMLAEGETLLSDGSNEMRARCANRISDLAQFPVEADGPGAEVLDTMFEEGGDGDPAFALVDGDGAGVPRHTGAGTQGPAYVEGGKASGMLPASYGDMGGMNGMTLARSGSSGRHDSPLTSATTAPVPAPAPAGAAPTDTTPAPSLDPAPAGSGGGTGAPLPPGAAQPPATGGTGGGGDVADPVPSGAGTKPGPFIPEPSLAPPAPATSTDEEKPASGEVPEPPTFFLLGAALAGMAFLRRRPRAS